LDADEIKDELLNAKAALLKDSQERQAAIAAIFNEILEGKRGSDISAKALKAFGPGKRYRVFTMVSRMHSGNGQFPFDEDLMAIMREVAGERGCSFYNGLGSYVCVIASDGLDSSFNKRAEEKALKEKDRGLCFLVGEASQSSDPLDAITNSAKQVEALQVWCLAHPETIYASYESLKESMQSPAVHKIFELPYEGVSLALKSDDAKEVELAIALFFDKLNKSGVNASIYYICLCRLAHVIGRRAYHSGADIGLPMGEFLKEALGLARLSINRIELCKARALALCKAAIEQKNKEWLDSRLEKDIVDYIKTNSSKSLNLQSLSDAFSLPSAAVSRLVKKATGMKFNDVLNMQRIECAKKLIAGNAGMKMATVCEASGYSDYVYFTGKFKELTGVSPSEYKRKFSS
jgi:two-component system response regulator YesN